VKPVIQNRLRDFTCRLLERRGALVEWNEDAEDGLAMLTPELAETLREFDILRLLYEPSDKGLSVNLATDFLEKVSPLLQVEPQIGCFKIPELYLKKSPMDEPITRAFTWQNAKVKVLASQPSRVEYEMWYFQAALDSEDHWEDVVAIAINTKSLAEVPFLDGFNLDNLTEYSTAPLSASVYQQASKRAQDHVWRRAATFIARLEQRLERDRKRLRDYYHALLRESKTARLHHDEDEEKRKAKRTAVELELRRKLTELDDRYQMRLKLSPVIVIRLDLPVLAVPCEVFRKQARRTHTVFWNPLTKTLEPMCCSACGRSSFSVFFTDNKVNPVCPACWK